MSLLRVKGEFIILEVNSLQQFLFQNFNFLSLILKVREFGIYIE